VPVATSDEGIDLALSRFPNQRLFEAFLEVLLMSHLESQRLARYLCITVVGLAQVALGCGSSDQPGPPVGAPTTGTGNTTVVTNGGNSSTQPTSGGGGGLGSVGGAPFGLAGSANVAGAFASGQAGAFASGQAGGSTFGLGGSGNFGTGGAF
jgi:hypothetical protein